MWNIVYNTRSLREIRKKLRNNATDCEKILWEKLKWSKFHNLKFRRQHSVGNYVLDFYCPLKKIWIELDGIQHLQDDNLEYDRIRTEYLNSADIDILRIMNSEIYEDIETVLEKIEKFIFS